MHINHRRKNRQHGVHPAGYMTPYSLKWYKRDFWQRSRAHVRDFIRHERYDHIVNRYNKRLTWDYW